MRTRRASVAVVGAILLAAVALGTQNAPGRIEDAIAPPATWSAVAGAGECDDACTAFKERVAPSLGILVAEGNALAELGRSRSRNVIELTIRMDRFRAAGDSFFAVLDSQTVPPAMADAVDSLVVSINDATAAMDASIAAIRAFDWYSLAVEVDRFGSAIDTLSALAANLAA